MALKIVMLGDGLTGKTRLVNTYLNQDMKSQEPGNSYTPYIKANTIPCSYTDINSSFGEITILDMPGQSEYDRLRAKEYHNTDAFILVFSVKKEYALSNLRDHWIAQLREAEVTDIPILLVGMDVEQRAHQNCITQLAVEEFVAELKNTLFDVHYLECSFTDQQQIDTVFETAFALSAKYGKQKTLQEKQKGLEQDQKIKQKMLEKLLRKGIEEDLTDGTITMTKTFTM